MSRDFSKSAPLLVRRGPIRARSKEPVQGLASHRTTNIRLFVFGEVQIFGVREGLKVRPRLFSRYAYQLENLHIITIPSSRVIPCRVDRSHSFLEAMVPLSTIPRKYNQYSTYRFPSHTPFSPTTIPAPDTIV